MIAQHRHHRSLGLERRADFAHQDVSFLWQAVVDQVAGQDDHVGRFGHLGKQQLERAFRGLRAMDVADGGKADQISH